MRAARVSMWASWVYQLGSTRKCQLIWSGVTLVLHNNTFRHSGVTHRLLIQFQPAICLIIFDFHTLSGPKPRLHAMRKPSSVSGGNSGGLFRTWAWGRGDDDKKRCKRAEFGKVKPVQK